MIIDTKNKTLQELEAAKHDLEDIIIALKDKLSVKLTLGVSTGRKTWVAEILGIDKKFGYQRRFLAPLKNSEDSSTTVTYELGDGKYEIAEEETKEKKNRRIVNVHDGEFHA